MYLHLYKELSNAYANGNCNCLNDFILFLLIVSWLLTFHILTSQRWAFYADWISEFFKTVMKIANVKLPRYCISMLKHLHRKSIYAESFAREYQFGNVTRSSKKITQQRQCLLSNIHELSPSHISPKAPPPHPALI